MRVVRLHTVEEEMRYDVRYFAVEAGRPIVCIAEQILSPTSVVDVGRAAWEAARCNLTGVYHVANPEFFERAELARCFVRECGANVEVISRPLESFSFDDPRPLKSYLDATKFREATGMAFTSMRKTIRNFLETVGNRN